MKTIKFFKFVLFSSLGLSATSIASNNVPITIFNCPMEYVFYICNNGGEYAPNRLECTKSDEKNSESNGVVVRLIGTIQDAQSIETKYGFQSDDKYKSHPFKSKFKSGHEHNYIVESEKGFFEISEKEITDIKQSIVRINTKRGQTSFSNTVFNCEI
jgi:hypothetical protein